MHQQELSTIKAGLEQELVIARTSAEQVLLQSHAHAVSWLTTLANRAALCIGSSLLVS